MMSGGQTVGVERIKDLLGRADLRDYEVKSGQDVVNSRLESLSKMADVAFKSKGLSDSKQKAYVESVYLHVFEKPNSEKFYQNGGIKTEGVDLGDAHAFMLDIVQDEKLRFFIESGLDKKLEDLSPLEVEIAWAMVQLSEDKFDIDPNDSNAVLEGESLADNLSNLYNVVRDVAVSKNPDGLGEKLQVVLQDGKIAQGLGMDNNKVLPNFVSKLDKLPKMPRDDVNKPSNAGMVKMLLSSVLNRKIKLQRNKLSRPSLLGKEQVVLDRFQAAFSDSVIDNVDYGALTGKSKSLGRIPASEKDLMDFMQEDKISKKLEVNQQFFAIHLMKAYFSDLKEQVRADREVDQKGFFAKLWRRITTLGRYKPMGLGERKDPSFTFFLEGDNANAFNNFVRYSQAVMESNKQLGSNASQDGIRTVKDLFIANANMFSDQDKGVFQAAFNQIDNTAPEAEEEVYAKMNHDVAQDEQAEEEHVYGKRVESTQDTVREESVYVNIEQSLNDKTEDHIYGKRDKSAGDALKEVKEPEYATPMRKENRLIEENREKVQAVIANDPALKARIDAIYQKEAYQERENQLCEAMLDGGLPEEKYKNAIKMAFIGKRKEGNKFVDGIPKDSPKVLYMREYLKEREGLKNDAAMQIAKKYQGDFSAYDNDQYDNTSPSGVNALLAKDTKLQERIDNLYQGQKEDYKAIVAEVEPMMNTLTFTNDENKVMALKAALISKHMGKDILPAVGDAKSNFMRAYLMTEGGVKNRAEATALIKENQVETLTSALEKGSAELVVKRLMDENKPVKKEREATSKPISQKPTKG